MALSVEITNAIGVAAYHRIEIGETYYVPEASVRNSTGSTVVTLRGYATKEARDDNQPSIMTKSYRIFFGKDMTDDSVLKSEIPLFYVKSDDPSRADLYSVIKQLPEFNEAKDI